MRPPTPRMPLSEGQRDVLETLSRSYSTTHREVVQARALLLAADGVANTAIGNRLGVSASSVASWRARFAEAGLAGLGVVRPGRGRTLDQRCAGGRHRAHHAAGAASG